MNQILVVEDDAFTRSGLIHYLSALGYDVREATNVQSGWEMATSQPPDTAVIDVRLPLRPQDVGKRIQEAHGIGLAIQLKRSYPTMGIVVMSAHEEYERDVLQMTQQFQRSVAFLHKGGDMGRLGETLSLVESGRNLFSHQVVNPLALQTAVRARLRDDEREWVEEALAIFPSLSAREQEIAHLVSAGYATDAIAERLHLAPGTISNHITRVYQKLGLSDAREQAETLRPLPLLVKVCMLYDIRHNN